MRIGSLFSGIGGLDLACEQAFGGETVWQVEIDDHCQRVLAARWPEAKRHRDVRQVRARDLEPVDVLCGGFPCQDLSSAGSQAGLDGERSGLYSELLRLAIELEPGFVVIENVPRLMHYRERLESDFAQAGYGLIWQPCSASDAGAPHRRKRVFVLAVRGLAGCSQVLPEPSRARSAPAWPTPCARDYRSGKGFTAATQAKRQGSPQLPEVAGGCLNPRWVELLMGFPQGWTNPDEEPEQHAWPMGRGDEQAHHEPPRLVAPRSVKNRPARIKALGNAVVPQQAALALRSMLPSTKS
tara:strand:- start:1 stop:891 length:891 start_codon:yes stop_codon:yes gene_type:complete